MTLQNLYLLLQTLQKILARLVLESWGWVNGRITERHCANWNCGSQLECGPSNSSSWAVDFSYLLSLLPPEKWCHVGRGLQWMQVWNRAAVAVPHHTALPTLFLTETCQRLPGYSVLCMILVNSAEEQTRWCYLLQSCSSCLNLSFMSTKVTMRYWNKNAAGNWLQVQLSTVAVPEQLHL